MMVDRPVFAFESSFLDCLTQHYDTSLDPSNSNNDHRHQQGPQQQPTSHHRSVPPQPTLRSTSSGSAPPASLWFLRKRNQKRSTSSSSNPSFRPPSTGSLFSIPPPSLNYSLNSLGSLDSMNEFLKGMAMNSIDSIGGILDDVSVQFEQAQQQQQQQSETAQATICAPPALPPLPPALSSSNTPKAIAAHFEELTAQYRNNTQTQDEMLLVAHIDSSSSNKTSMASHFTNRYTKTQTQPQAQAHHAFRQVAPPTATTRTSIRQTKEESSTTIRPTTAVVSVTKPKSKRIAAKKTTISKVKPPSPAAVRTTTATAKRIRRKEPAVRRYVAPTELDVLLGRGGGSNHHIGNKAYRKRILNLQPIYKTLDRDSKTAMSHQVVEWVTQEIQGRFLKRENKGSPWYIVTDATARQKVSQALREDHTPEGRALKKSRTSYSSKKKKTKQSE
ncbi:unnamed protein product [Cylindrotheca closterium]|uniref:DUF6824 domain-containing protein n=1 Tax=Cylindrotheca closterium TaxID=2856 RepID=A0AAD2JJF1_9STRA|nr:unnamed protein product [Cylindrotheca closterium]